MGQMWHTTYKTRARLTQSGHARLNEVLRMNCWLYNQSLEVRKSAWRERQATVSLCEQQKALTALRPSDLRWAALAYTVAHGTLHRLDKACQAFFRRVPAGEKPGHPRFRSHRRWRTLEAANPYPGMSQGTGAKPWLRSKGLPRIKLDLQGHTLPSYTNPERDP